MFKAARELCLTGLILLVSGTLGLRLLEIIYRACCDHHVEERPWALLLLTSFFITAVVMGIVQRFRYRPETGTGRFFSTLALLCGLAAGVPAYFCALDILGYGHLNGPMTMPFIFLGLWYYARLIIVALLFTGIIHLFRISRIAGGIGLVLLLLLIEVYIAIGTGRFTLIDLGGALAEPGQMVPTIRYEQKHSNYHTRLWKKGENYVVEIPIAYVPARYPIFIHQTPWTEKGPSLNCRLYCRDKVDPSRYPEELYYAELTLPQLEILVKRVKFASQALKHIPLIPAEQYNPGNATLLYDSQIDNKLILPELGGRKGISGHLQLYKFHVQRLPSRRSWYNRCLQPLSWCAEVVDIPLSLLATPIGWLADAIYPFFTEEPHP